MDVVPPEVKLEVGTLRIFHGHFGGAENCVDAGTHRAKNASIPDTSGVLAMCELCEFLEVS